VLALKVQSDERGKALQAQLQQGADIESEAWKAALFKNMKPAEMQAVTQEFQAMQANTMTASNRELAQRMVQVSQNEVNDVVYSEEQIQEHNDLVQAVVNAATEQGKENAGRCLQKWKDDLPAAVKALRKKELNARYGEIEEVLGVQLESGDEDSNAVRAVQRDVVAFLEELQACKTFLQEALPRLNIHFKKLDKIKGAADTKPTVEKCQEAESKLIELCLLAQQIAKANGVATSEDEETTDGHAGAEAGAEAGVDQSAEPQEGKKGRDFGAEKLARKAAEMPEVDPDIDLAALRAKAQGAKMSDEEKKERGLLYDKSIASAVRDDSEEEDEGEADFEGGDPMAFLADY